MVNLELDVVDDLSIGALRKVVVAVDVVIVATWIEEIARR